MLQAVLEQLAFYLEAIHFELIHLGGGGLPGSHVGVVRFAGPLLVGRETSQFPADIASLHPPEDLAAGYEIAGSHKAFRELAGKRGGHERRVAGRISHSTETM